MQHNTNNGSLEFVKKGSHDYLKHDNIGSIGNKLDWFIIAGCSQLNEYDIQDWAKNLLRDNSVHGILGYYDAAPTFIAQNGVLYEFSEYLYQGHSFINAWRYSNSSLVSDLYNFLKEYGLVDKEKEAGSYWAVVYNGVNKIDTIRNITADDTKLASQKNVYKISKIYNETIVSNTQPSSQSLIDQDLNYASINKKCVLDKDAIQNYFSSSISNNSNSELEFGSIGSFKYNDSTYNIEQTKPITINGRQALEQAKYELNKMNICPEAYIANISKIVETEIYEDGSSGDANILEYQILFIPSIESEPVYTKDNNGILVCISEDGIVQMDYNWIEFSENNQPN